LSQLNRLLSTLDYWRFHETGVEKNLRVSGQLRYNSGHALVDAALKGLGIVQLPDYYVDQHLQTGAPCSLLELQREAKEGIRAVYPHNRQLSPKNRLLVDYLAERLRPTSSTVPAQHQPTS